MMNQGGRLAVAPVIGIDLGGTQLRVAVLRGTHLLSRVSLLVGNDSTPRHVIPEIYHAIADALDQAELHIDEIGGIGVGVAGPLDSQTGVVFDPPNLTGWHNVPLCDIFKERYPIPIFIENDANVAGIGEYMFGAGQGSSQFVYVTISTGIGGCVIVDGQLQRGISGTAGELGHMTVDWRGERCNCGNTGCLESIASGTAIARRAQAAMARGAYFPRPPHKADEPIDAKEVALAAVAGVEVAKELIHDAAEALGVGLVNIIHIFNPEIIVLGGGVAQSGSLLLEPALRVVQQRAMKNPASAARIIQAALGADVGLIGAGALVHLHRMNGVELVGVE